VDAFDADTCSKPPDSASWEDRARGEGLFG
ncbi:uncharacterized protein METZ01_LOCUS10528, partial [marine metagenome]